VLQRSGSQRRSRGGVGRRPIPGLRAPPWLERLEGRTLLTFLPAVHHNTVANPVGVAAADFNAGGLPDLAVTLDTGDAVGVRLNDGAGDFPTQVGFPVGRRPLDIAAADFNADGVLDLAVSGESDTVSVLLGNGDGTFQNAAQYGGVFSPSGLAAGDLTGDG